MDILCLPDEILDYILLGYVLGVVDTSSPMWRGAREPRHTQDALDWLRKTTHLRRVCRRFRGIHDEFRPMQTFVAIISGHLDNAHMPEQRPLHRFWTNEQFIARTITCPTEQRLVDATPNISHNEIDKQLRRIGTCPGEHWEYGPPVTYAGAYTSFQIVMRFLVGRVRLDKLRVAEHARNSTRETIACMQARLCAQEEECAKVARTRDEVVLRRV